MKNLLLSIFTFVLVNMVMAQETPQKVMEKRAREMYRAITLDSKDQWKKFITENYSQALIDKPVQGRVEVNENGNTVSSSQDQPVNTDKIEAKARMFSQLNADFGDSKIASLKVEGEKATMVLQGASGLTGTITIRFEKSKPYLIDGLGIEVEN